MTSEQSLDLYLLAKDLLIAYIASGRTETVLRGPNGIESSNVPVEQGAFIMAKRFLEEAKKQEEV